MLECARFRPLSGYSFSNTMDMRVNPETILNVFVPSRGTRFLIPRQKLLSITSLIGFRPLSGYSISNRGHYDIEELRAEVFVPSRGTRFLMSLRSQKLQRLKSRFRPLSGYSISNKKMKNRVRFLLDSFRPLSGYSISNEKNNVPKILN